MHGGKLSMVGIDIIEVSRVEDNEKFLNKIAHQSEIDYINLTKNPSLRMQKIAALFSVKEAVMKALGLGKNSGVVFKDIILSHEESGRPIVSLQGKAKEKFEEEYSNKKIYVSLSHIEKVAVAIAIIGD